MKTLEPFTIYVFVKGRVLYGVSQYKDLENEMLFGSGFRLDRDKKKRNKDNTPERIKFRAKRNVIYEVSNSLNALLMYGLDVLGEDKQVDWNKFRQKELEIAEKVVSKSKFKGKEDATEDELFEQFEKDREKFEKEREVKTFKVIEIDLKTAKENKLI